MAMDVIYFGAAALFVVGAWFNAAAWFRQQRGGI